MRCTSYALVLSLISLGSVHAKETQKLALAVPAQPAAIPALRLSAGDLARYDRMRKAGKALTAISVLSHVASVPLLVFAFFDSYESAMENSKLPETAEFGHAQSELLDEPMIFTDLDVVSDESL